MAHALDPRVGALLEQDAAPERLFPALLNALQDVEGTTVLVFEDVHWADNATLDLVKYLGRRVPAAARRCWCSACAATRSAPIIP